MCPIPVADPRAPPVYLPVGVGGLTRLELSPGFPNGIGTPSVSNGEVAMLCAEGIDVRALDLESFPASFSIVRRAGRVYGNLWSAGRTPEDVTTQWLTFDVDATGYFGQGEHAAIALFLDAPALAGRLPAIIGNGIVFGEVELAPSGCGGSSFPSVPIDNTEVEAFWRGGNSLWGESCGSAALANDQVYRFLVRADTAGAVRYESRTGAAQAVASAVIDTSARRPALDPANGGILIGSTNFCSTCPDFEIRFTHVAAAWSTWPIDDARMAQPVPLSPDVTRVAFAARTTGTRALPQRVMFTNTSSSDLHPEFRIAASEAPHCDEATTTTVCANERDQARRSFVLDDSDCTTLRANGTCMLTVGFEPQAAFDIHATLEYRIANGGAVGTIALEGYGIESPESGTDLAIEYFDASLGHYFITTLASEQALLDAGTIAGWKRTGQWFRTYSAGSGASKGANPVCRYYGRPEAGLDSHFYSASPSECRAVAQRFPDTWMLETSELFDIRLPEQARGQCPEGLPVYRLWNAAVSSNHRYTTDVTTRDRMTAAGWISEGYGASGVAMCSAAR